MSDLLTMTIRDSLFYGDIRMTDLLFYSWFAVMAFGLFAAVVKGVVILDKIRKHLFVIASELSKEISE